MGLGHPLFYIAFAAYIRKSDHEFKLLELTILFERDSNSEPCAHEPTILVTAQAIGWNYTM